MRTELSALMKGAADPNFDAATALTNCANNVNAAMRGE